MGVTTTQTNKPFSPRGNDQSPLAFNRAKLYSGKALDFDGVNDEIDLDGFTMSGNTASFAFHLKADEWNASGFIFDSRPTRLSIGGDSANANTLNIRSGTSWLKLADISDTTNTNHFVITIDGTAAKLFLNGKSFGYEVTLSSEIDLSSNANTSLMSYSAGASSYFNGQLSNVKVFNTALTAAQVADLYNNPEKVVPTGVDNTALKLWLPMQEGAGTTAYNGAPDALGSELVTNGTFDTSDDWSHSAQWSIGSGKASYNGSGSGKLYQTGKNLVGTKNYILTFDVSNASTYANIWIGNQAGLNSYTASATYQTYYNGTNAVLLEGANIGTETTLAFYANNIGSSFSIDNISLKEVANCGTISGATWTHGIGAPVSQTSVINWNKWKLEGGSTTNEYLIPQGLTSGRDLLGNLFENVRKQGALNLDGNSWAEVHDNESLDFGTGSFTLEAWARVKYVNQTSSYNVLFNLGGNLGGTNTACLASDINNNLVLFYGANGTATGALTSGDWVHIVGVYDGANAIVYANGVKITETARTPISITNALPKKIGTDETGVRYYKDQIAQPRIYNRALTAAEVQKNYNAGKNTYTN